MMDIEADLLTPEEASKTEWDAVIVGAGTAGSIAAWNLSRKGLNVLLIDKKGANEIGRKICGDVISTYYLRKTRLPTGLDGVTEGIHKGVEIFSPNGETVYRIDAKAVSVNRHRFGRMLLDAAMDEGAKLVPSCSVLAPILEGKTVKGVVAKRGGESMKIASRIVIDASGWVGVIRRFVAPLMGVDGSFKKDDLIIAYREVRRADGEGSQGYLKIFVNQETFPGGYGWAFLRQKTKTVNLGVGVQLSRSTSPQKSMGEVRDRVQGGSLISQGWGVLPIRRSLESMVWSGLVIIGDAASTVVPLYGEGIGPSMFSAQLMADTLADLIADGKTGVDDLWEFNIVFMETEGRRNAKLDVFRMLHQSVSDDDLNFAMKERLVDERMFRDFNFEDIDEGMILHIIRKFHKLVRRTFFLRKLLIARGTILEIDRLYERYPKSRNKFIEWRDQVQRAFRRYALKLGIRS